MILPTKHLKEDLALIKVGGRVLSLLDEPKTISRLWEEFKKDTESNTKLANITYDWFVLSLDFLYLINTIKYENGRISRAAYDI